MKLFYFTATGNSLAVAKEMGGELYSIPQVLKRSKLAFADEKVGIIFPCYYFSLPQPVKEFIKEVKLESDYTFAIMTYGNLSFKAVDRLARLAKKSGLKLDYTNQLLMVDNYLPLYDIETELEKEASKDVIGQDSLKKKYMSGTKWDSSGQVGTIPLDDPFATLKDRLSPSPRIIFA